MKWRNNLNSSPKNLKYSLTPILAALCLTLISFTPASASAQINLGSAGNYQILAGTAITIGGGVVGADPQFDGISSPAVADLSAAIAGAAQLSGITVTADLGGSTYTPGVYLSPGGAAFAVTGNVILDGQGANNPEFIFYTPAAMNTTAGITISLINGAQAKDIYWIAGGAITTGASGILFGNFLSSAAITTGASNIITGCLLGAAAVTIGAANVFHPCLTTVITQPSGSLSISVPLSFKIPDTSQGSTTLDDLGRIIVTDSRSGFSATTWITAVNSSGLQNANGDVIPASAIGYLVSQLQTTGGISATSTDQSSLTTLLPVVVASGAGAENSASWLAKLTITIPNEQPSGSYAGTITHSVY